MNKKMLVLAPHPDDELLLAGALIYTLKKKKYDITVAYFTGDDSSAGRGAVRMREAVEALDVLGIRRDNVVFLGYGNNWKNGTHLYNMPEDHVAVSYAGRTETYGLEDHPEYCMLKSGTHRPYTRQNAKEDIRSLIMDIGADLIICVDFDSHADHRALSLLFEEVMGEILHSDETYRPIVLKKFAYAGMNSAKWDYYYSPMLETQPGYVSERLDPRYECDNPVFRWEDRIQLKTDKRTRTRHISSNILYKAACRHKSQKFDRRVGTFANADMVYWQRRTDSISYRARVTATSGRADYVNDFKMIDCPNVMSSADESVEILRDCVWIPDENDGSPTLFMDFESPVRISKVHIYENFLPRENIVKARLVFDSGKEVVIDAIDHKGRKTEVVFETQYNVRHLEFQILEREGTRCGLTELEVYEDDNEQEIPLERYQKPENPVRNIEYDLDIILEKKFHGIAVNHSKEGYYYDMYQMLRMWDNTGNDRIVNWLRQRRYTDVAIYGMGDFGRKLHRDLESAGVRVVYTMDQYAGSMAAGVPVVRSDIFEEMPAVDAVIVTVIHSFAAVKRDLVSRGCDAGRILSLQDIINEAGYGILFQEGGAL
ncbi:PIG-L family deacetylase [Clostridiaceae bacterium]|jgi:LmbE family N-acetylglucosaminyl deacetylase|nr:PIG-L family deacetylase [Clostridium sp.]NBI72301.1 PIG-L family deacetylase [Clostridiaceae bacterium]